MISHLILLMNTNKTSEVNQMEQFVICPKCGEVRLLQDVQDEIEHGGNGMCFCEYSEDYINERGEEDVRFPRIFNDYVPLGSYMKGIGGDFKLVQLLKTDEGDENDG